MTRRPFPLLCLFVFALAHADGERVTYTCDDGNRFDVAFSADSDGRPQANLRRNDQEATLPQVPAASGARYLNTGVSLHTKGDEAVLDDGQGKLRFCKRADDAPPGTAPSAATGSFVNIGGSVTWHATSPLPPDAVLIVRIQDTARAGAPALTLAEQRIGLAGHPPPIPFKLTIDRDLIGKNAQITVAARIERKGRLLFISDSIHRAFRDGQPRQVDIGLVPVGAASIR